MAGKKEERAFAKPEVTSFDREEIELERAFTGRPTGPP